MLGLYLLTEVRVSDHTKNKTKDTVKLQRTLYVDGSNLYPGMTDLVSAGEYIPFSEILTCIDHELAITKVKFYGAYMRVDVTRPISAQLVAKAQIEFFNEAKTIANLQFHKGHYNSYSKEKGVDVKIAVDLVRDGYENDYDEAVIMSGDDDFLYAVDVAKLLKPMHMAAFASRYGYNMAHKTWERLVFDYQGYFKTKVQPTLRKLPDRLKVIDLDPDVTTKHI